MSQTLTKVKEGYWVSYQGECTINLNDVKYDIRASAYENCGYKEGVFEREILPLVGTVKASRWSTEFPPTEIIDWVKSKYGSHYVGARFTEDYTSIEYTETPPEVAFAQFRWKPVLDED